MNTINTINNSGKNITFSGTDTIAFIILPNTAPICLGSLTTLSYSSYRVKTPINTLGGIKIKGVAKGIRTIAGTFVFTLINQHWVNELVDCVPWLKDKAEGIIYSDELPPFDIMLVSANEYGKYVSMQVYGVDLTDEAGVLSVNDMYAENTFSFIAREIKTFNDKRIKGNDLLYNSNTSFRMTKGYTYAVYNTNEYEPDLTKKNYTYEPTIYDRFPKECRIKLLDLGYIKHSNAHVPKRIEDAIDNLLKDTGYEKSDKDYFIQEILPHLTQDYISNKNYIAKRSIKAYSNKNMDIANNDFKKGERVYILSNEKDNLNRTVHFTNKGYIYSSDIEFKINKDKSSVKDITIDGSSVMDKIKNNDVIETNLGIDDFLDKFKVTISSKKHERYYTNVCVKTDDNTYKNDSKDFISNGDSNITFKDREDFIKKYADGKSTISFVVINQDTGNSYVTTVKFNKYKHGGIF